MPRPAAGRRPASLWTPERIERARVSIRASCTLAEAAERISREFGRRVTVAAIQERPSTILHELIHAAFQTSGIGHTMRLNLKKEEQIAHAIAPFVAQALVTGGFWKTPRGEE